MNQGLTDPEDGNKLGGTPAEQLKDSIAQAQHDLRNPLGNILGFCEWLLPEAKQSGDADFKLGLESIYESANQMVTDINRVLDPDNDPAGPAEVASLQARLRPHASQIMLQIETLVAKARVLKRDPFSEDLLRMAESAGRLKGLIETALSFYG